MQHSRKRKMDSAVSAECHGGGWLVSFAQQQHKRKQKEVELNEI